MLWGENREIKKPAGTGSRTQDTSGLSHQCSAPEPWQPDNHQLSQILYVYCTGGTDCLSRTPGNHRQNTVRGWRKILSIKREPMLNSFLTLNAQSILPHTGNTFRCYKAEIKESAEHWRLKPEASWVRLPVTDGFFPFLYFCLIKSKFIYSHM